MFDFSQGLRDSFRLLRRKPAFALMATMILALGIGATSAVFSLIHGVLLVPPPFERPDRLVLVTSAPTPDREGPVGREWRADQWQAWAETGDSFDGVAAYRWFFNFLIVDNASESLEGMLVTENFFDVLGVRPVHGRTFRDSDSAAGASPTVIIGHDLWQRRFNGDPAIVGTTLRLSRQPPATIVGVMPAGIRFLPSPAADQEPNYDANAMVDFWVVIPRQMRERQIWNVVARLRDGVTLDAAGAELEVMTARQRSADPALAGQTARIRTVPDEMNGTGRRILLPLLGAAALVLLVSCGNAGALLLVRGLQRQHEYGLRSAVGAGRARLFGHVIVESLVLALIGGGMGVILARAAVEAFKTFGGDAVPRLDAVTAGWPLLAIGLGSAVVACLLAGLLPAVRAASLDPVQALRGSGPKSSVGRGERRLLSGVIVAQTALTLALLVGAGLLIRTMANLAAVDSGFETSRVATMSVTAVQGDWAAFHTRALERVSALPGVERAAFAWGVPLTGNNWPGAVEFEGATPAAAAAQVQLPVRSVTSGYFAVLGQTITDGRDVRATDIQGTPLVAVVNRALVDRYFAGRSPLGRKVWLRGRGQPPSEIVGVVSNGRTDDLTEDAAPEIYLSLWQATAFSKHLVVRTVQDPLAVVADVQRELRAVDPTAAVENVRTLDEIRGESLATQTFAMRLLVGFAVVATVLTLGGIYGVLSLSVAARRREIAIRSAVGAHRSTIVGSVLGEGLRLVAAGVTAGTVIAVAVTRMLQALLFEVGPSDPLTLFGAALSFTLVALLACAVPAARAMTVEPAEALRND